MHEKPIKLILLEEKLDQLLPVLFAAQGRLNIKKRVL